MKHQVIIFQKDLRYVYNQCNKGKRIGFKLVKSIQIMKI